MPVAPDELGNLPPVAPPAPGAHQPGPPPGPRPDSGPSNTQRQPRRARGGGTLSGINPIGALVMAAVITLLAVIYMPLRDARTSTEDKPQQSGAATSLELPELDLSVRVPKGWKAVRQDGVVGSRDRVALGPKGSRLSAIFITVYDLRSEPRDEDARNQVRREAEASLRITGSPKPERGKNIELDGSNAWTYSYRARSGRDNTQLDIYTILAVRGKRLTQISCQAPSKNPSAMTRACESLLREWRWPE